MKKHSIHVIALGAILIASTLLPLFSQTVLDPYLELELKRLEETYRLMDKYGQVLWPGWTQYDEVEFKVQFPNLVYLLVTPKDKIPAGYEAVPGRTIRGKKIYINRKDELPIKIQPPLTGGGGGGLSISIMLQENKITPEEAAEIIRKNLEKKDPAFDPPASSDYQILLYIHEFFHGNQMQAKERGRKAMESAKKSGSGKPEKAEILPGGKFMVNSGYSTYSNIEGLALLDAFREKDAKKALESFKDYLVARRIKHEKFMTPGAAANEKLHTFLEGTALYSNTKMMMFIKDRKYKPALTSKEDPFFYGFKFADSYIYARSVADIEKTMNDSLDTIQKWYTFGLFQCLGMDRFFPGWKKDVLEYERNLDEVMAEKLKLSEAETAAIAERLKTKYDYDALYAKHEGVIKDRDEIMNIVTSRKGLTYIVDLGKTRELVIPEGRGRFVNVEVAGYYINGIKPFVMGGIELTTWDTPIHKPFLTTIEWTDTEAKPDEKRYTFYYEKQEGDVYKNVVFTTPGFTLKAPEVKIQEKKDKNQLRIVCLSKVAR